MTNPCAGCARKVRVMLNPARRDGTSENHFAREALLAVGIKQIGRLALGCDREAYAEHA
jgi:hypothetical protein